MVELQFCPRTTSCLLLGLCGRDSQSGVSPCAVNCMQTSAKHFWASLGDLCFPVQVAALPCGTPAVRSRVVHQDPARREAPREEETLPLLLTPMQQCSAMFKEVLALYVPKHCMWPARLNNAFISAFSTSRDFSMQLILAIVLLPSAPANYVYWGLQILSPSNLRQMVD